MGFILENVIFSSLPVWYACSMASERLQKILSRAGIASRRKAEELISDGLVTINGKVAKLGDKAEIGKDAIKVKGKLIQGAEAPVYLAFNKPKAVLSTLSDPEGRATVSDFLSKVHGKVFPVGRLDYNSEGLLILTNDGVFAERAQKSEKIPRVYQVKVRGTPDADTLRRLENGVKLEGRKIKPQSVKLVQELASNSLIEVVMVGSGVADIKKLFEMRGLLVVRMVRTAIGHITLKNVQPGRYKFLRKSQVDALFAVD